MVSTQSSALRRVVTTWLVVYPTLTLLLAVLGPWLAPLATWLRTLIVTAVFVPLMVLVLMPRAMRVSDAVVVGAKRWINHPACKERAHA